jgi:hypothetical protein
VLRLFRLDATKFGSLVGKKKPTIDREVAFRASGGELRPWILSSGSERRRLRTTSQSIEQIEL